MVTGVRTARELRNRVAAKWGRASDVTSYPEHVVLYEVPFNGRGGGTRQRIDVVAVGVWTRTQGLVHGFELKVSRADLLHELRDLSKSDTAVRSVDRWWLVLGSADLLKPTDPVPESWGIIVARGRGLSIVREAQPQAGETRALIVGMVTRALVTPRYIGSIARREGYFAGIRWAEGATGQRLLR